MANKYFSMSTKELVSSRAKGAKAELKRRGRDSSGKKIGSKALQHSQSVLRARAKAKTPRKSTKAQKPWNDLSRWPTIGGMEPWYHAGAIQYTHQEDQSSFDVSVKLLKGGYRVAGEWSAWQYGKDSSDGGDIHLIDLTYSQAIRAVVHAATELS